MTDPRPDRALNRPFAEPRFSLCFPNIEPSSREALASCCRARETRS